MIVAADSRWRLRDGTRLDRLADLPDELRARLAGRGSSDGEEGGDEISPESGVLSRVRGRTAPVLLDPDAADLLEQFGDGKSVAQSVLDLARARDLDPHELLEASLPAVERLVGKGYLIDVDSPPAALGYGVGDTIGGEESEWRIARVLSRLEDSEVHLVQRCGSTTWGVLKLSTPERRVGRPEHELGIHRRVAGRVAEMDQSEADRSEEDRPETIPELLDEGELDVDGTPQGFFVLELVRGLPIHLFARGLRAEAATTGSSNLRRRLATLCASAARAFADLHRHGIAHGDVHPDNLLVVGPSSSPWVRLIDLGCARRLDDGRELASRPGIDNYREPEVAQAMREKRRSPAPAPTGEQYALAVVLFQLATGHDYLDFSADRDVLLRQVAEESPRSFDELGIEPWPAMEKVLRRALSKEPGERYESMDHLARAFDAVTEADSEAATGYEALKNLERSVAAVRRRAAAGGDGWATSANGAGGSLPESSLFFGTAGLAWGLLHAAVRRGDSELLALADLWTQRALRGEARKAGADEPPSRTGDLPTLDTAPFHGATGVHEVAACVSWARGELRHFARQARRFLAASRQPDDVERAEGVELDLDVDLAVGRPGSLVSAAHLLTRSRPPRPDGPRVEPAGEDGEDRFGLASLADELKIYGDDLLDELWQRYDARPEIGTDDAWLGVAHGWGGALYATLVWCRVAECEPPAGLEARLHQLADEAVPHGRGLRWTRNRRGSSSAPAVGRDSMAGWCHGSAGYVLLYHTAARHLEAGSARFRDVAEAAAWDAWDRFVISRKKASHLCCGLAGQAWSLLVHARETGDEGWVARARALAESAARRASFDTPTDDAPALFAGALFKGEGSLPALLADLECPWDAAWPWMEDVEISFERAPGT